MAMDTNELLAALSVTLQNLNESMDELRGTLKDLNFAVNSLTETLSDLQEELADDREFGLSGTDFFEDEYHVAISAGENGYLLQHLLDAPASYLASEVIESEDSEDPSDVLIINAYWVDSTPNESHYEDLVGQIINFVLNKQLHGVADDAFVPYDQLGSA